MTKYEKISVLARETAKRISANREEWIRYLDVASRLYKYPFEDQILIYAQRPDATACMGWKVPVCRMIHFLFRSS